MCRGEAASSASGRRAAGGKPAEEEVRVVLYGKSVDVSSFARVHPGGAKVLRIFQDRDATEQFAAYHSASARRMLESMLRDAPDAPKPPQQSDAQQRPAASALPSQSALGRAFDELTDELRAKGLFEPHYLDELFKISLVLVPYAVGVVLVGSNAAPLVGALLIGFACYMSGWVSHDYLHHSVFPVHAGGAASLGEEATSKQLKQARANVRLNNAVGYWLGWIQGYEELWWKARHNTHHVVTNEHGNDPDIKTAPVLVFIRNNPTIARGLSWVQRWQQFYYLPVLSIMDLYWRLESHAYLFMRPQAKYWRRTLLLLLSDAFTLWLFHGNYRYLLLMTMLRGFATGVVVFATHYGEDILDGGDHGMTLVEQTALTSRNIKGGHLVNVLTGFISLQTEHHLWPTMPTAHLEEARKHAMAFFHKHGLEYREGSLLECVRLNIKALGFEHLQHLM